MRRRILRKEQRVLSAKVTVTMLMSVPTRKKDTKKKALNTTWDEESSSEEEKDTVADSSENVNGKFVAFMVKSLSDNDTDEDHDDEMSDQEKDWEELYHTTYANCVCPM